MRPRRIERHDRRARRTSSILFFKPRVARHYGVRPSFALRPQTVDVAQTRRRDRGARALLSRGLDDPPGTRPLYWRDTNNGRRRSWLWSADVSRVVYAHTGEQAGRAGRQAARGEKRKELRKARSKAFEIRGKGGRRRYTFELPLSSSSSSLSRSLARSLVRPLALAH